MVLDYDVLWCLSILAPSAPILLRSSSFLRRSIADIHGYRSVQKRAPTDEYISSYDAIKLVPNFIFHKKSVVVFFAFGGLRR